MASKLFDEKTQYLKGFRIRIYPTESQSKLIDTRIDLGIAIYNWTIEQEINQYNLYKSGESDKKFLSYFDMINKFTDFRKENPWVLDIPYGSGCLSIRRAVDAFKMFFRNHTRFPRFKSKKHLRKMSYGIRHDTMYFDRNMLRVEGFPRGEMIYTKWDSGFDGYYKSSNRPKYYSPTITKDNMGRYFISFCLLKEKEPKIYESEYSNPIGIDLNVADRFVCSNGYRSGSPNLTRLKKRLSNAEKSVQQDIERRKKEARTKSVEYSSIECSKRAIKRLNKRRKIQNRIDNIVENFIQQETCKIIKMNPTCVVMEDLSVTDMDKNRKVAKKIHYSNFSRCITVMSNKCNKYNIPFKLAHPRFPSSQLCSRCGSRKKIYSSKVYICPKCGMRMDRDLNAAKNLEKLAF